MESQIDFDRILKDCASQFPLRRERWSDHGPLHWKQVERNAIYLAQRTRGADGTVCRLFALMHDCQRENEHSDSQHGHRAVQFLNLNCTKWNMGALNPSQYSLLSTAIAYHADGAVSDDSTIGCCWDADRLDLPRVRIMPKMEFMSTVAGKKELEIFTELRNKSPILPRASR